jgi:hypothetical protein
MVDLSSGLSLSRPDCHELRSSGRRDARTIVTRCSNTSRPVLLQSRGKQGPGGVQGTLDESGATGANNPDQVIEI